MPADLPAGDHEFFLHICCKGTSLDRVLTFNGLPSGDAAREAADALAEWCLSWGRSQGLVGSTRAAASSVIPHLLQGHEPGEAAASSRDWHPRQLVVDKGVNTDTEALMRMNRTPSKASIGTSGALSDGTSLALLAHSNSNELISSRFKLSGKGQPVRQESKIWRLIHKGSGVDDEDDVSIADYEKWSKLSMAQDTSLLYKDKDSKGSRPPSGKGPKSVFGRIAHGVKSSYLGGKHDTKAESSAPPSSRSPRGRSPDKESKGLRSGVPRPPGSGRQVGKLAALPGLIRVASVSSRASSASSSHHHSEAAAAISPRGSSPSRLYRMDSPFDDSPTGQDARAERLPLLEILTQAPGAASVYSASASSDVPAPAPAPPSPAAPTATAALYTRYGRSSHARHPSQGSLAPAGRMCWESRSQEGRPSDGELPRGVPGRTTGASARLARPVRAARSHDTAGSQAAASTRGGSHASSSRDIC